MKHLIIQVWRADGSWSPLSCVPSLLDLGFWSPLMATLLPTSPAAWTPTSPMTT